MANHERSSRDDGQAALTRTLARKLAKHLDALAQEILRDVHAHALADDRESGRIADAMWAQVAAASELPTSVMGELWLAVLELATSDESAFGWLCRAAAVARTANVPWADFLASVKELGRLQTHARTPTPWRN